MAAKRRSGARSKLQLTSFLTPWNILGMVVVIIFGWIIGNGSQPTLPVLFSPHENRAATLPDGTPANIVFINDMDVVLDVAWMEKRAHGGIFLRKIDPGQNLSFNSFIGHVMLFTDPNNILVHAHVVNDVFSTNHIGSHEFVEFRKEYYASHGYHWRNLWPREATSYHIWPSPVIGHTQSVVVPTGYMGSESPLTLQLEAVSTTPKIHLVDGFLSDSEVKFLLEKVAALNLARSTVGPDASVDDHRTSKNTWVPLNENREITMFAKRAFELLRVPFDMSNFTSIAESFQVLEYGEEQWYREHYDYFPPEQRAHLRDTPNRFATLFIYLNDVEEGGETYFPRVGGNYIHNGCEKPEGFKVPPKKGRAVLFYSLLEDGNLDFNSLHGGCHVKKGKKFAMNLWFWDKRFAS